MKLREKIKENKRFLFENSLQILGIVLVIYFGINVVDILTIKTIPELGFCPSVCSGNFCFDRKYSCSDSEKEFPVTARNEGTFLIEAEVFNKGLVLALDTELEINITGAKYKTRDNEAFRKVMDVLIDDKKINFEANPTSNESNMESMTINPGIIHTLKPSDSKKVSIIFHEDFGFNVRPSEVIFTLKNENGKIADTKTIFVNYTS